MASESEVSLSPLIQRLMMMPLFASTTATRPDSHPNHDSNNPSPDRIILINPLTQGMVVIGGGATGFDSLMNDLTKDGVPPASESSIESLPSVEIKCEDEIEQLGGECVICLEELGVGDLVTEMPCKHTFHGGCVKKWLKVHGSCPICRYKMPVADEFEKKVGGRRREIWVTFAFGDGESRSESEGLSDESSVELNDLHSF